MTREHPEDRYTFTARPLHEVVTEGATRGLWVLLGATALLLLIACTNVANLLLARAVVRERDLAVRASLGAEPRPALRPGDGRDDRAGAGRQRRRTGLAWALLRPFVATAPANFPRIAAIGLDLRVLLFARRRGGRSPASWRDSPRPCTCCAPTSTPWCAPAASRSATAGRARAASRLLVVSEVALALALVTTAGLMTKSLLRLQAQDLGMTREPVLTFASACRRSSPPTTPPSGGSRQQFLERVRAVPGVTQASAIDMLPVAATGHNGPVRRADQTGERDGVPVTEVRVVMDGYVARWGCVCWPAAPSTTRDRPGAPPVVVVNDALAARLWPDRPLQQVVGQQVRAEALDGGGAVREVVGVVAGVRSRRPDLPPDPEVHAPFAQLPVASMSYVVRADGDPSRLTPPIRAAWPNCRRTWRWRRCARSTT